MSRRTVEREQPSPHNDAPAVMRWDGSSRLASEWDQIRKDPDLWIEGGDVLVHLAAPGQSRRGPAFLVPSKILLGSVLASQTQEFDYRVRQAWDPEGSFARKEKRLSAGSRTSHELFLPPPIGFPREEVFDWHITTRNYFAFCSKKCLVGRSLGQSLITLHSRLELWRPHSKKNTADLVDYARMIGYLEFAHCPDYALALLALAEHCQLDDLWIDAFTHCVGMYDMLGNSGANEGVSISTQAYIKNYASSMDARIKGSAKSLATFLEEDLSDKYVKISEPARIHLDTFRDFLSDFYSHKFGNWPPPRSVLPKNVFKSMHSDFRNLLNYLVDPHSSSSMSEQRHASEDIPVLHILQALDNRYGYKPLPHPYPRLPIEDDLKLPDSKRALDSLENGQMKAVDHKQNAFTAAANNLDSRIMSAPLVRAFQHFEGLCITEKTEKLSLSDGRKVSWILVYGILQLLNSVTYAPSAVRDVESPTYALCCDTVGIPPWRAASHLSRGRQSRGESSSTPLSINALMKSSSIRDPREESAKSPPETPAGSVSPDYQEDDYFKPVEIPIPSWRDVFSMRDPSTAAVKALKKQMGDSKTSKASNTRNTSAASSTRPLQSSQTSNSSRYTLNLLGGSKRAAKAEREKERAKIPPPGSSSSNGLSVNAHAPRQNSASTDSARSNKSAGIVSGRMDSVLRPNSKASSDALGQTRTGVSAGAKKAAANGSATLGVNGPAVEPRSPGKREVAPWEAMEPSRTMMSGAVASSSRVGGSGGGGGGHVPIKVATSLSQNQTAAGDDKAGAPGAHSRAKSIPLVPT